MRLFFKISFDLELVGFVGRPKPIYISIHESPFLIDNCAWAFTILILFNNRMFFSSVDKAKGRLENADEVGALEQLFGHNSVEKKKNLSS